MRCQPHHMLTDYTFIGDWEQINTYCYIFKQLHLLSQMVDFDIRFCWPKDAPTSPLRMPIVEWAKRLDLTKDVVKTGRFRVDTSHCFVFTIMLFKDFNLSLLLFFQHYSRCRRVKTCLYFFNFESCDITYFPVYSISFWKLSIIV